MKSRGKQEALASEPCPCESGRTYGRCCKKRRFRWLRDGRGNLYREVPLPREALEAFQQEEARFVNIFGRKPGKRDLLFPDAYLVSADDLLSFMIEMFEEAGVRPELAYAYEKTGLLLTQANKDYFTESDLEDWSIAIEEFKVGEAALDPHEERYATALTEVLADLNRALYVFGLVLHNAHNAFKGSARSQDSRVIGLLQGYVFFCFTKSAKTLKAIRNLLVEQQGEDAIVLTRCLYENYLSLVFLLRYPEKVEDLFVAKIGVVIGTHEHAIRRGKVDYRTILEKKTGRRLEGRISMRRMAEASPFAEDLRIHELLYDFLSRYAHPDPLAIEHYITDGAFDPTGKAMFIEAAVLALFSSWLTLDIVRGIEGLSKVLRADLRRFLKRSRRSLEGFFDAGFRFEGNRDFSSLLMARFRSLDNP